METKTVLHTENVNSRIVSTDSDLIELLYTKLRKRPKDFWHNVQYKKKRWDGWHNFFDKKTGKFQTGILPEVRALLRHKKVPYTFIDERTTINWLHQDIDEHFLDPWIPDDFVMESMHDFQPDLARQALKYSRGLIQAPTGAGKTLILISILKSLPPKTPVLFLTKNSGLVHQNYTQMERWGVENLGRWYANYKEPNYIMCATSHVKTFKSLGKLLPKFKVLLVDEVHECMSDVPARNYKKMKSCCVRLGFSATPFKWNKKKIDEVHKWKVKGHFGPVFKTRTTESGVLTTKDLQDRGILSKSNCTFYPIKHPDLAYEPYQDAVKMGIEQNLHFHEVVSNLARSRTGRTLIVVERLEQGGYLKNLMPEAHWIQGKDHVLKVREPVLDDLRNKDKVIAIFMKPIITAGIDIKIHDLINAAGGEGAHSTIQLMGRGLRLADDKDILDYHDFHFLNNDYLRKHSEWRMQVLREEGHNVIVKESLDLS